MKKQILCSIILATTKVIADDSYVINDRLFLIEQKINELESHKNSQQSQLNKLKEQHKNLKAQTQEVQNKQLQFEVERLQNKLKELEFNEKLEHSNIPPNQFLSSSHDGTIKPGSFEPKVRAIKPNYPIARPTNIPNIVISPYTGTLIQLNGVYSGQILQDPEAKKMFIVP